MIKQKSLRCPKCGAYDIRSNSELTFSSHDNITKMFYCINPDCNVSKFQCNWQITGMTIVQDENGKNVMPDNAKSRYL